MVQKMDAAQAKADKLIITLKEAEEIAARLMAKEKPPEGGKSVANCDPRRNANTWQTKRDDMTALLDIVLEIAQAMFKPPD